MTNWHRTNHPWPNRSTQRIALYERHATVPTMRFSARAVDVLTQIGRPFAFVNILEKIQKSVQLCHRLLTGQLFPQLWVAGELIGGSDIIYQMFQDGELQPLIEIIAQRFSFNTSGLRLFFLTFLLSCIHNHVSSPSTQISSKNFHGLLGQEHVSKALINAIHNQRLHHAYLYRVRAASANHHCAYFGKMP